METKGTIGYINSCEFSLMIDDVQKYCTGITKLHFVAHARTISNCCICCLPRLRQPSTTLFATYLTVFQFHVTMIRDM